MNVPTYVVTAAQVRTVAQPVQYRLGQPHAYLCPDCEHWHPYTAPKLYDPVAGRYHGAACAGSASLLTARQLEVLGLLASGLRPAGIGRTLGISRNVAASHIAAIYRALGLTRGAGSPRDEALRWYAHHFAGWRHERR